MASLVVPSSFCRISSSSVRFIVSAGLVWSGHFAAAAAVREGGRRKLRIKIPTRVKILLSFWLTFPFLELKKVVI